MTRPAQPLILVVDDDDEIRGVIEAFLRHEGFAVETAATGAEAIEKALRRPPALVLLDYQMPGMDGWRCAERLRSHPATARVPIVAVTGYTRQVDRNRAMQAGVDGYLDKPVDLDQLLAEIRRVLGRDRP
ncbi:MAG TPA: response regulator [Vicinamibacterales bacterium]|jgi:CheY-like chemotaxis protein|nr:response regulator [Vicinamibacterales bacterium]